MIGRKALTGLSLLCALCFCAFGASSAVAATSGTTAVTCVEGATKDFTDAHCDTTGVAGSSKFGHAAIAAGEKTEIETTNAGTANETKEATNAILKSTIGGLEGEIICTGVSGTGKIENKLEGEVHKIISTGVVLTYTGCTAPKPTGQGCKVWTDNEKEKPEMENEGQIMTVPLKGETITVGTTHKIHFVPETGTRFASFFLTSCKTEALSKTYEVTGSVNAEPNISMTGTETPLGSGSTIRVNLPKNPESTLELSGQKAGLTQLETIKMKGGNPIGTTASPFTVG